MKVPPTFALLYFLTQPLLMSQDVEFDFDSTVLQLEDPNFSVRKETKVALEQWAIKSKHQRLQSLLEHYNSSKGLPETHHRLRQIMQQVFIYARVPELGATYKFTNRGSKKGLRIHKVSTGGTLDAAGLKGQDIILSIGDQTFQDVDSLEEYKSSLQHLATDNKVKIVFIRKNRTLQTACRIRLSPALSKEELAQRELEFSNWLNASTTQ